LPGQLLTEECPCLSSSTSRILLWALTFMELLMYVI
jgi:hypothetical protein